METFKKILIFSVFMIILFNLSATAQTRADITKKLLIKNPWKSSSGWTTNRFIITLNSTGAAKITWVDGHFSEKGKWNLSADGRKLSFCNMGTFEITEASEGKIILDSDNKVLLSVENSNGNNS